MIEIPVFTDISSDFVQNIDLEGTNVTIRLVYNTRSEKFFMDLETANSKITGLKLVLEYPIISQYKTIIPDILGDFFVLRISDDEQEKQLTFDNFGKIWSLFYFTQQETFEVFRDFYSGI